MNAPTADRLMTTDSAISTDREVAEPANDHTGLIVLVITSIVSLVVFLAYYNQGLTLAYHDGMSRLNIARRVFDNISPGLPQLGGVWLPLPQILMLPFVWVDPLYRTGIAGSIMSMVCFVISTMAVYGAAVEVTGKKAAGVFAALTFIASPSMLYMQTTPMSEPATLATITVALYFMVKWGRTLDSRNLYMAAGAVALSTLCRYDGWFMFAAMAAFVFLLGVAKRSHHFTEGSTLAFVSLGGYGVFLWLFYSWMIFGDPLNFAHGPGTAAWYAEEYARTGAFAPKGNLYASCVIYGWAMVDIIGPFVLAILPVGLAWYIWEHRLDDRRAAVYLFLAPILFNVVSLFLGQSIMSSIHHPPNAWYNTRYGLMALPAVALFAGYLASKGSVQKALIVVLLIVQVAAFLPVRSMPILADPLAGQEESNARAREVIDALNSKRDGGKILIGTLYNDALVFDMGLDFKNIIFEGNHPYWDESLVTPSKYASWIVMKTSQGGDNLYHSIGGSADLRENFEIAFQSSDYILYHNLRTTEPIP